MIFETPDGKLFGFLHIPRTGGRFLKMNLLLNGIKPVRCTPFNNILEYEGRKVMHFTKKELFAYLDRLDELKNYTEIPFYSICRNPVDRFISASNNLPDVHKQNMSRSFADFKKVMEEEDIVISTSSCDVATKGIVRSPDSFFRFQTDYMEDSVDFMRYEEGYDTIIEWLSDELNTNIQMIEKRLVLDSRSPVDNSQKDLTPEIIEFASEYYKEDCRRFGYPLS